MADAPPDVKIELFDKADIESFPKFSPDKEDKRLFDAIQNEELIVFYGAGVSMLAGCASWRGLADNIIDALGSSLFSELDRTVLKEIAATDARRAISICHGKVRGDRSLEGIYFKAMEDSVTPEDEAAFADIHEQLYKLNATAYITTNIDRGIESIPAPLLAGKKIVNMTTEKGDVAAELRNGNIFYLHGALGAIPQAIFTIDQYIEFYYTKSPPGLPKFLEEVFSGRYAVLFLGYGLSEFEILQNIYHAIASGRKTAPDYLHFLLTPIYSRDIAKFNIERSYFNIFSVRAIPYFLDHQGYRKLYDALSELRKNVEAYGKPPLDAMTDIDSV